MATSRAGSAQASNRSRALFPIRGVAATRHLLASVALASLLLGTALTGCSATMRGARSLLGLAPVYAGGITEDELQQESLRLGNRFIVSVRAAADRITSDPTPREINRRALLWKLQMVPLVQRAATLSNAQESWVALYMLAMAQRKYLVEGEGAELFAEHQHFAIDAARRVEADALQVGETFLSKKQLQAIRWQLEDLTWRYPIRGLFLPETMVQASQASEAGGAFDWVIGIPLSPFRALEGVDTGAQAIREFNTTAQQFAEIVSHLPEVLRWESELLLYDIEDRETVQSIVGSLGVVASSAERLSEAAARLPADARAEAERFVATLDAKQGALQKTVADARAGLGDLDAALAKANDLAQQLDRVGATWHGVATTIRGPDDGTPSRPFDITEYERAAARIEASAHAVRELALELQKSGEALAAASNGLLWRAIALVVAFFALRLGFRLLEARIGRTRGR